ncbi:hypothetical protein CRUP_033595, partial [Coryphaenoides rupestris]
IENNDIHHLLDQHSYRGGDETAVSDNHIVIQAVTEHPTENKREELQDAFSQILDNNIPTGDAEDYFTSAVVRATGKDCTIDEDSKPIERERCLAPPNHAMGRLFVDVKGEGPLEHCPCVGELQCQPQG